MSGRGLQVVLVAMLGLAVRTMTGADTVGATATEPHGESAAAHPGELAVHRHVGERGGQAAVLFRAPFDRSAGAARAQRLVASVAVLVGGALALRSVSAAHRQHLALPVWSGWFADPGRL